MGLVSRLFGGGKGKGDTERVLQAAGSGDWQAVEKLVRANPELSKATRYDGWTPLHFAVNYGDKYIADLLIGWGADVNAETAEGWTPLHMAATAGDKSVVQLLIAGGANVHAKTKMDMRAAWIPRGYVPPGATPLRLAVTFGRQDVAALLRFRGARE